MPVASSTLRSALLLLSIAIMWTSVRADAQPSRAPHADPCFDYEVSGRVVHPDGTPAGGLTVVRVESPTDHTPYRPDLGAHFAPTTHANGTFRIAARGLGLGAGLDWTLLVARPHCPDAVLSVHLEEGAGCGRYEALGLVIQLAACAP